MDVIRLLVLLSALIHGFRRFKTSYPWVEMPGTKFLTLNTAGGMGSLPEPLVRRTRQTCFVYHSMLHNRLSLRALGVIGIPTPYDAGLSLRCSIPQLLALFSRLPCKEVIPLHMVQHKQFLKERLQQACSTCLQDYYTIIF